MAYAVSDAWTVSRSSTAEAPFAAIREPRKLGIAIAATIRMIATTISSSMSENPACLFRIEILRKHQPFASHNDPILLNLEHASTHSRLCFREASRDNRALKGPLFVKNRHNLSIRVHTITKEPNCRHFRLLARSCVITYCETSRYVSAKNN